MRRGGRWTLSVVVGLALLPGSADAARVTVRIEGAHRTLVPSVSFNTTARIIGLYSSCGLQGGCLYCDGNSLLGALDGATRGRWNGGVDQAEDDTYYATSILGERHPAGSDFWDAYIDGHEADPLCDTTMQTGDSIVFFPSRGRGVTFPLALTAPATARRGRSFTVTVTSNDPTGAVSPVQGAAVRGTHGIAHTDKSGRTRLTVRGHRRQVTLRASKRGLVRSDVVSVRVRAAKQVVAH